MEMLSYLPELTEIRYTRQTDFCNEEAIVFLENFLRKKKSMSRSDLKVQFGCVMIDNDRPLCDYEFESYFDSTAYFYLKNYLIDTKGPCQVNYADVMRAAEQLFEHNPIEFLNSSLDKPNFCSFKKPTRRCLCIEFLSSATPNISTAISESMIYWTI